MRPPRDNRGRKIRFSTQPLASSLHVCLGFLAVVVTRNRLSFLDGDVGVGPRSAHTHGAVVFRGPMDRHRTHGEEKTPLLQERSTAANCCRSPQREPARPPGAGNNYCRQGRQLGSPRKRVGDSAAFGGAPHGRLEAAAWLGTGLRSPAAESTAESRSTGAFTVMHEKPA